MVKFAQTIEMIQRIRKHTDTAVLFYSAGGKDSIALLDLLSSRFDKVICVFMYLVPDLAHFAPYLTHARKYPNTEIIEVRHWTWYVMKRGGLFCNPDKTIKEKKESDVIREVKELAGIPYVFHGMKGVDGYMKRMRLKKMAKDNEGLFIDSNKTVYPLALWTNKDVLQYISLKGLPRPFDYGKKSVSSGLGLMYEELLYIKTYFPSDYKKILEEFPYCDNVFYKHEREEAKKQNQAG